MTWPRKQSCAVLRPDFSSQTFFGPFNFTQLTKIIWTFSILTFSGQILEGKSHQSSPQTAFEPTLSAFVAKMAKNVKVVYLGSFGSNLLVVAKVKRLHQN